MWKLTMLVALVGCAAPTRGTEPRVPRPPTPQPVVAEAAEAHDAEACGAFEDRPDEGLAVDGWSQYRVKLSSKQAAREVRAYITHIEYQRQHATFSEAKEKRHIANAKEATGFTFSWRGYAWVPVIARVHFKDGTMKDYSIDGPPELLK